MRPQTSTHATSLPPQLAQVALIITVSLFFACSDNSVDPPPPSDFQADVVVQGLTAIWDLAWGPDGRLWATERGGRVSRIDLDQGTADPVGQIEVTQIGEGGLMGMAFHPDFATQPFVYFAHTTGSSNNLRNRLIRLRFNGTSLVNPEILLDNIPGASIHNGARLAVGPDQLLYMTTGDAANPALAQDVNSLAGKVLRLTLDGQPAPGNPFGNTVYSFGHRNPQGLAFHPESGAFFVTEHGPADNDEVNRIEAGRNYGWPDVRGFCDRAEEQEFCQRNNVAEPLAAWTPTIAPAGADFYLSDRIPGWRGSFLFTTLKGAALVRLSLTAGGSEVTGEETLFRGQFGRLRDVLVTPDGAVYLATSNRDGRGGPTPEDDRIIRILPR